jgi:hypothetical protein
MVVGAVPFRDFVSNAGQRPFNCNGIEENNGRNHRAGFENEFTT